MTTFDEFKSDFEYCNDIGAATGMPEVYDGIGGIVYNNSLTVERRLDEWCLTIGNHSECEPATDDPLPSDRMLRKLYEYGVAEGWIDP